MSDERIFQAMYNTAYVIADKYNINSLYSTQVYRELIKCFGRENSRLFYKICNRIQKQYS